MVTEEPRRAGTGSWVGTVLLAVVVLAGGLWSAWRTQALADQRAEAADLRALAELATGMAVDLGTSIRSVGEAARQVAAVGPDAATARALVDVPGAGVASFVPGVDPDAAASFEAGGSAALDRARDSGVPGLVVEPGAARAGVVAAAYGAGPGPPTSAADRRARLLGWVVAELDLSSMLAANLPEGAAGEVRGGRVRSSDTATQTVEVGGALVTIAVERPTQGGLDNAALAVAAGSVVVAGILGAGVLEADRRRRAASAAAARSDRQVQLIGEVAPLVQRSLDLGEVLPSVAVLLSDHFGLAGVRLSTGTPDEGFVEQFTLGTRAAAPPPPVLQPPSRLAAGEAMVLALQRGGRSVALLELVAGRDLDAVDLQSLRVITELLTAAVVNASLYADQQLAVHRLRDLDALKTVFLSTASHELRTPATAISGFASLLSGSWDHFSEEQRRDFADRIAANARSLGGVVQDLLDFSLIDRGEVAVTLVAVDLGAIARDVVGRLGPVIGDHQVLVEGPSVPMVQGEVNGLERVITNLLTNAIKFSPAGSTVRVALAEARGGVAMSVSDEGAGVAPEERERIFTRFYRGEGEAVIQTRGVGIGLSVVQELVVRMGGTIAVDEAPGGGARFTVWLPLRAAATMQQEGEDASTS